MCKYANVQIQCANMQISKCANAFSVAFPS